MTDNTPQLNLITIKSTGINKCADFYSLLGLKFIKHRHGQGPEHYASENNSFVFEIYPADTSDSTENVVRMGFIIKNLDKIIDILRKEKVIILTEPQDSPWGRRAVVLDTQNNRVELVEVR